MTLTQLVVECCVTQATFHIQFVAFVDILFNHLSQLAIEHEVVPIGTVGYLRAVLQRVSTLGGSQCNLGSLRHILEMAYLEHFLHQ